MSPRTASLSCAPEQIIAGSAYDLRLPGQIAGSWGGTYQNRFRDYDPAVGRFVESDPAGLKAEMEHYRLSSPVSSVALFATVLLVLLSACSDRAPPLGRGLPKTFGPSDPSFGTRLRERFPIGTDAVKLTTELRNEGFVVSGSREPGKFSARYEAHSLVCKESWAAQWTAEQGKIAAIDGSHHQACL